jgi:hypothetical protein
MPWFLDPKRLPETVSSLTFDVLVAIGFIRLNRPYGARYLHRTPAVLWRRAHVSR